MVLVLLPWLKNELISWLEKWFQVAKSKRDYDVKKAAYDTEVNTAKAEAEMAYKLKVKMECIVNRD